MRKITLFLSVLFMAIVVKAQVQATTSLVHTASSFCTSDKNSYTSTVDSDKEVVNNSAFNNTWQAAAYAEFSVTLPEGNYSVKNATLTWTGIGESRNTRNTDVLYANVGQALDYETMSAGTAKVNLDATYIGSVVFPKGAGATQNYTTDVTDAVKTILEGGQNFIIFKFTNNPGGGHLVGKGASENMPVLTVELAEASAMTTYTVKYVDEAGNEIAEAAVYDIVTGEVASIADENKTAIYNADKSKKYVYVSCDNESITTVADSTANVITATFRESAIYSYTVNAVDGDGNVLKVLATSSNFEGETITVPYNQYILIDGVLYGTSATDKQYNKSITLSEDNLVSTITYTVSVNDVVYFSEAEEIEGLTITTGGNANIRCSNAAGGYNASADSVVVTTLTPGVYNVAAQVWGNAGVEFRIVCGDDTLKVSTAGYILSGNAEFAVSEETEVTILQAGANGKCLDWIYIQSVEKPLTVTDGVDLTATGTYTSATYERLFNTDYTYGTICLPFAPDAATCANYTFYKLAEVNSEALYFEEETAPKANVAYLYKLNEGVDADAAKTFTGGVTTISDVEVESVGGWNFIGVFAKTKYEDLANSDGLYYAYTPTAEKDILTKATNSLTVHPYRAFFKFVETEELNFTPATATMRLIIPGQNDGGANSIEGVITPDQIDGAIFDLEGRPVQEMLDGQIYIIGGKKVMK